MENKTKKIWLTIFSWSFLLLSFIISLLVPEARDGISNYSITNIYKTVFSTDYRFVLILVGYLALAFAILYGIEFYNKKYRGYSPDPNESEKELIAGLHSLWLMLEAFRTYAVILGLIVLIARVFGFDLSSLLR